jgi:hypothetical protein
MRVDREANRRPLVFEGLICGCTRTEAPSCKVQQQRRRNDFSEKVDRYYQQLRDKLCYQVGRDPESGFYQGDYVCDD